MKENQLKKLIKKDRYQIFLFSCPISLPGSIALHYWFIVNKKGKINRWEVLHRKSIPGKKSWEHLYRNVLPLTTSLEVFVLFKNLRWKSKLVSCIEGDKNSLVKKMVDFIESSPKLYPYTKKYNLIFGPNSNTYIQWILNEFPESGFKLSWRAIGKRYKITNSRK